MNKTVRLLACLLVTLLVAGLMPGAMAAADGEYGDYHGPDVQVINRIITENNFGFEGSTIFPLWEVWQEGDTEPPSSWGNRVWWDEDVIPKRVVYIELWGEDTYGSGLVDLRGLDFLQACVLGYSGITGVNANGLSRLERFGFHANPEMTWLGSEGLSALERFLCSDCVKLAGIDLSDSPDLFELQCLNGQSLASLNLGNLQKVKSMALGNTRLSSLDVSRITDLEELYCWGGILSSLTLGTLPNLIVLDCTDNKLTSLDLSGLPALEFLTCAFNPLARLDVSGLSNLYYLDCEWCYLDSLVLHPLAPFSEGIYVRGNIMESTDAITGRSIDWAMEGNEFYSQRVKIEPTIPPEAFDGSGDRFAEFDANLEIFEVLLYQRTIVSGSNYGLTEGSTIITLPQIYLGTLAEGSHRFTAIFGESYGYIDLLKESQGGETEPDEEEDGGTDLPVGQSFNYLSLLMMLAAIGTLAAALMFRSRKSSC